MASLRAGLRAVATLQQAEGIRHLVTLIKQVNRDDMTLLIATMA